MMLMMRQLSQWLLLHGDCDTSARAHADHVMMHQLSQRVLLMPRLIAMPALMLIMLLSC